MTADPMEAAMPPTAPVPTTVGKLGRGLAASCLTAGVLLGLFLMAVPIYITLLTATLPTVVDITEPLFLDYRLPEPTATIQLLPPELRSKAYAYAAEDKPVKKFPRVFPPGQQYDVMVRLELPDSEQNVQVGIFQVTVQLLSARGDIVATTTQPAMLHYRSKLVKLARLFAMAIPIVLNFVEERQLLTLPMLKGYQEGPLPVVAVRVLLEPSAGRGPGLGLPQVYSAEVEVKTRLTGLISVLYNWRFTSLVWGPFAIFVWELLVVVLCCPGIVLPGFLRQKAATPTLLPVASPVDGPVLPAEEELLRSGAAAVGDLEDMKSLGIDDIPKDVLSAVAESVSAAHATTGESTASESEAVLTGSSRRTSVGAGVGSGSSGRRKSVSSSGPRFQRADSQPGLEGPDIEDEGWGENMEKVLEDILEVQMSPEASDDSSDLDDLIGEGSDVIGEEDDVAEGDDVFVNGLADEVLGDGDMPLLEDGAAARDVGWSNGAQRLGPEDPEGVLEEAAILAGGASSRLNELAGYTNGETRKVMGSERYAQKDGLVQKRRPTQLGSGHGSKGAPESPSKGVEGLRGNGKPAHSISSERETLHRGGLEFGPRRSQSLDSVHSEKGGDSDKNGVDTRSESAGESGAHGTGISGAGSLTKSGGDSPRTGVYSRFLSRGFARSSSSDSLSEQTSEQRDALERGQEKQAGNAEFKDASEVLDSTVSDASMLDASEDLNDRDEATAVETGREWADDVAGGLEREQTGYGGDPEAEETLSLLGSLVAGVRRRPSRSKKTSFMGGSLAV